MKCDRCYSEIKIGDERNHLDQTICEDCYIDSFSHIRTCDPWAVYLAKSCENDTSQQLTQLQLEILANLEKVDSIEPSELLKKISLKVSMDELEREFATLRHMEKVRGQKQGAQKLWRLW